MKKYRIVGINGEKCPRCNEPSEIREHFGITDQELQKAFYYTRWYNCRNQQCQTTIFFNDDFKVINRNKKFKKFQKAQRSWAERQEQDNHIYDLWKSAVAKEEPPKVEWL